MHELGIMTGVMDAVVESARQAGATRVLKVSLAVGEMTEAIEDALAGLKPATGIEGQKPAGQLTSTGAAVIGVAAVALLALAGAVALAARRRMTGK